MSNCVIMKLKIASAFLIIFLISSVSAFSQDKHTFLFRDYSSLDTFFESLPPELKSNTGFKINLIVMFKSYPEYIKGISIDENDFIYLLLFNGERCLYDDKKNKTFEEKLNAPDIEDTLSLIYPMTNPMDKITLNHDPGRFRSISLLKAVYGKTKKEVGANLIPVNFCGNTVLFNKHNGASEALQKVSDELSALIKTQPHLKKYVEKLGGTFNWRTIAGTEILSAHSFGIAIDLNTKVSAYWRESSSAKIPYFSRLNYPIEIIKIFEAHGFIWGGKWYHYDTMHFEYRPELLQKSSEL